MEISKAVMSRITERIGAMLKAEAIRRCPVDNGILRQSIDFKTEDNTITIYSELPYAAFVEYGTGIYHIDEEGKPDPHSGWDIVPINGKALRFEVGRKERLAAHQGPGKANIVFAKKVHIEGAQPHPFMRPAIHQNIGKMKYIIADEIQKDHGNN
jgi:HK97 gp10 family phage protein